jgi:hypothetical protein
MAFDPNDPFRPVGPQPRFNAPTYVQQLTTELGRDLAIDRLDRLEAAGKLPQFPTATPSPQPPPSSVPPPRPTPGSPIPTPTSPSPSGPQLPNGFGNFLPWLTGSIAGAQPRRRAPPRRRPRRAPPKPKPKPRRPVRVPRPGPAEPPVRVPRELPVVPALARVGSLIVGILWPSEIGPERSPIPLKRPPSGLPPGFLGGKRRLPPPTAADRPGPTPTAGTRGVPDSPPIAPEFPPSSAEVARNRANENFPANFPRTLPELGLPSPALPAPEYSPEIVRRPVPGYNPFPGIGPLELVLPSSKPKPRTSSPFEPILRDFLSPRRRISPRDPIRQPFADFPPSVTPAPAPAPFPSPGLTPLETPGLSLQPGLAPEPSFAPAPNQNRCQVPARKLGYCRQGYFSESASGRVSFITWSSRKCQPSKSKSRSVPVR